jgi:pentatricopeptide repeat protein
VVKEERTAHHARPSQTGDVLVCAVVVLWWLAQTPDLFVFSGLLQVLGKARQPDKALHYFAEIERSGLTPDTHCFSALIAALGTAGRVDDAERHFAQMTQLGVVPNAHCFSALIAALGTAGRVDDAERHFAQMAQLGVVPDTHCFNALISGFAEAGRVDEAERWFAKITTVGRLKPDLISYNALIKANEVAARPERALKLLQEMAHKVLTSLPLSASLSLCVCVCGPCPSTVFDLVVQGVRPDVVSYNTVISSLAKARRGRRHMDQAQEVFDQMVQQGVRPDATTFGALIHGHALVGDLETVRNPFPPPRHHHQSNKRTNIPRSCVCGRPIINNNKTIIIIIIIMCCARAGQAQTARDEHRVWSLA